MAAVRGDRCGVHADAPACPLCVGNRFQCQVLFPKTLKANDLEKFYIPKSGVAKIYPAALNAGERDAKHLLFYDAAMQPWEFKLSEIWDGRSFLTGNWKKFVEEKQLSKGITIEFYELKCKRGTGKRFFQIGRLALLGKVIA